MKHVVVLLVVFVMMLVMVAPAFAGPPEFNTFEVDNEYVVYDNTLCPGISITKHEVYTVRETLYFDKQGNLKSIKGHAAGTDSYYNTDDPGVVLSGNFAVTLDVDPQTGELLRLIGAVYHITAPGYGTVLVQAGLVTLPDGHVTGKNSFVDPKDVAQFCSILGGG